MSTLAELKGGRNMSPTLIVLDVHNCKGLERFNKEKAESNHIGYRVWKRSEGWQVVEHQDSTYDRIKCEKVYFCPYCGENLEGK